MLKQMAQYIQLDIFNPYESKTTDSMKTKTKRSLLQTSKTSLSYFQLY